MGERTLDIYAERARVIADNTMASGRTPAVRGTERLILRDVMAKLAISPDDRVLDIGSGIGTIAIPLSYFVESVTCVDHPEILTRLAKTPRPNILTVPGSFYDVDPGGPFTKVIAYSMAHYLGSLERVCALVDRALTYMAHGGLMLLGDVPNEGFRDRTVSTPEGQRTIAYWTRLMIQTDKEKTETEALLRLPRDTDLVEFGDTELLAILLHVRKGGNNAWLLRQPDGLPWAHQREDVMIQRLVPAPKRDMFVATLNTGALPVFSIRVVMPEDCDMLYAWSQDPTVRSASIRSESFTIEQHREWFARKMASTDLRWYIFEEEMARPVGQVRYERVVRGRPLWTGGPVAEQDGGAEVSLSLVPRVRGLRLSRLLLDRTGERAKKELGVKTLVALVRKDNEASAKAFERAGYKRVGEETRLNVALWRYEA